MSIIRNKEVFKLHKIVTHEARKNNINLKVFSRKL